MIKVKWRNGRKELAQRSKIAGGNNPALPVRVTSTGIIRSFEERGINRQGGRDTKVKGRQRVKEALKPAFDMGRSEMALR